MYESDNHRRELYPNLQRLASLRAFALPTMTTVLPLNGLSDYFVLELAVLGEVVYHLSAHSRNMSLAAASA